LTSALGANTGKPLAPDERARFQVNAVRARAVGVGPAMGEERARAIMFARVAGMAQGGSGVSIPVFQALVDALNRRVYPAVSAWGTISVSDLPPLAHIALVLIGEGDAFVGGQRVPGRDALAHAGLAPVALGPKDGLVLVSANAAPVAAISSCDLADVRNLDDIVALSFEGFARRSRGGAATDGAGRPKRPADRPCACGTRSSSPARATRSGSAVFRCVAQVHGAARTRSRAPQHVEIEPMPADSPRVDIDASHPSTGNFHIRPRDRFEALVSVAQSRRPRRALHEAAWARNVGSAPAADATRSAAIRVCDGAEDPDRARERHPASRQPGVPRLPARVGGDRGPRADGDALCDEGW
jgi:histidine ammonia-lyase